MPYYRDYGNEPDQNNQSDASEHERSGQSPQPDSGWGCVVAFFLIVIVLVIVTVVLTKIFV